MATVDLTPPRLDLDLYHGQDKGISVHLRDAVTKVVEDLTGWTGESARMRPMRGSGTIVDLLPIVNLTDNRIEMVITTAMKVALGSSVGVWEVEMTDPSGIPITFVHGDISICDEVGM